MLDSGDEHGGMLKSEGGVGGDHNREKTIRLPALKCQKNDSTFLKCFVALCFNIIPHEEINNFLLGYSSSQWVTCR